MPKLTDYILAHDVRDWVESAWKKGIPVDVFALETFFEEIKDPELLMLREVLVNFGFERGEAGAFLTFLDGAIRHKNSA